MSNETSKAPLIVGLLLLVGAVAGGVMYSQHQEKERRIAQILTTETVAALEHGWTETQTYRNSELPNWDQRLHTALDERFLPSHYSFINRQVQDGKALLCQGINLLVKCDTQKMMEKDVMTAFQTEVLDEAGSPAQMTQKLLAHYTTTVSSDILAIPQKHPEVSPERLQAFLSQVKVQLPVGGGDAATPAPLAELVQQNFNAQALSEKMFEDAVKGGLEDATTHLTTHFAKKAFGSSAKYVFGPLVKVAFMAYDYHELKQEEAAQRGPLRDKLSQSLTVMEASVAADTEKLMQTIETGVLQALPNGQGLTVAHTGPALVLAAAAPSEAVQEEASSEAPAVVAMDTDRTPSQMPYALQIASREDYAEAQALAAELPESEVFEKWVDGKRWYVVFSGGFNSKESALEHKQYLLANYSQVGGARDIPEAFVRKQPDQKVES